MSMEDYYKLFVQLSMQQWTRNDYTDKHRVKAHDIASTEDVDCRYIPVI